MKLTALTRRPAYRMHTPRWAFSPLSGGGAARHGGRVNRRGVEVLYLSLDEITAVKEYKQLSTLMPPGTLVQYEVTLAKVVDFSGGYTEPWPPEWQDFYCDWRKCLFDDGIEPPTWAIGDQLLEAGYNGVLFGSTLNPAGINLAVYLQNIEPASISVCDAGNLLPKNSNSWD